MSIRFHPEAEAEIGEIAQWYEDRRPGLGLDFADELDRAFESIEAAPLAWPFWPQLPERLSVRRFLLQRFPFGIPFRVESGDVAVYAVAHLNRRPFYWRNRLK